MSVATPITTTADSPATPAPCHARVLAGWLTEEQISRLDSSPATLERCRSARAAVAARPEGFAQSGLIAEWPAELEEHGAALRASPAARRMFDEGWRPALITDLRRIVAAQPTLLADDLSAEGRARTAALTPGEVARLALPLDPRAANIQTRFDEERQQWIVTSPDPNLRITATFSGEVQPNVLGVGFFFEVLSSFVSVAEVGGRHVLRDGYHRCHRLLAAGITAVPAFVRAYGDDEPVFSAGMLDRELWRGPTPPTLADYHDDRVSIDVVVGAPQTTAIVAAGPRRLAVGRLPQAA
jgi:hypothetical protein